jgi:hypothetical protein
MNHQRDRQRGAEAPSELRGDVVPEHAPEGHPGPERHDDAARQARAPTLVPDTGALIVVWPPTRRRTT